MDSPFHNRLPGYQTVPIAQIRTPPDVQIDAQFLKLLRKLATGSLTVSHTRIRSDLITTGFFRREGRETVHVSNLRVDQVDWLTERLRQGDRPSLDLYWSPLSPHDSKLVCPDDEAWLAAYRAVGITFVPATIHDPGAVRRTEGAVWRRMVAGTASYFRALAPEEARHWLTFFSGEMPPFQEIAATLAEACVEARGAIRAFHREGGQVLHYHQMLHALVLKHERVLETVARLVADGRSEHACAVVRMAYEAFLGFYVDWLSPSFFGPRLQLVSHLESRRSSIFTDDEKAGHADTRRALGGYEKLLTSVAEKARISPLGERFHNALYPTLSWVAHQAYGVLEPQAMDFTDTVEDDPNLVATLGQALDVVTAAMLMRIRDDVGALVPINPVVVGDERANAPGPTLEEAAP